jgi:hypothetical protein
MTTSNVFRILVTERGVINANLHQPTIRSILSEESAATILESASIVAISQAAQCDFVGEIQDITAVRLNGPLPSFYRSLERREVRRFSMALDFLEEQLADCCKFYPKPPSLPDSWLGEMRRWLEYQSGIIVKGRSKGLPVSRVVSDLLGAYRRHCNAAPTLTVNGPAYRLLTSYFRAVRSSLANTQFEDASGTVDRFTKLFVETHYFPMLSTEQIRKHIGSYCKYRKLARSPSDELPP